METTEYVVATISTTAAAERLKREDCSRTKHDPAFSNWKTLIGPSNWEDYALGKEGAEKYMVPNLPNCTFCPGVYELGIVLSRSRSGRHTSKLDPDIIIPVYLGKSVNVRNRLQEYGRGGAHLENDSSNCKLNDYNNILTGMGLGCGLFSEIFTKGFSIVYRWAPMTNPREAKKMEAELLDKFDYAWNKGSNGPRRPNDILKRIDSSRRTPQRLKGINFYTDFAPKNFPAQVLKFGRSRPILVPWTSGIDEYLPSICGVALGHGVVCTKPPSEGRKRCAEHKGMKINATSSKLLVDMGFTLASDKHLIEKDIAPVCGFILPGGSSCTMEPVQGNKRCLEHKGRKVCDSMWSITICGPNLEDGTFCTRQPPRGRKRCDEHQGIRVKEAGSKSFTEQVPHLFDSSGAKSGSKEEKKNHAFLPSVFSDKSSPTCGMALQDGGLCSRKPVEGNKRCWQHHGMRVDANSGNSICYKSEYHSTASSSEQIPYSFASSGAKSGSREEKKNHAFLPSVFSDKSSPTCGMTLQDGGLCSRKPVEGNKRCWQHHGMRVHANSGNRTCYKSEYYSTAPRYSSSYCGAPKRNGSPCRRISNGPCWQHGG